MASLVSARSVAIEGRNAKVSSPLVTLAPKTAEVGIRILTPTPTQGITMPKESRFRVVLVVVIDGEEYRSACEGTGGEVWFGKSQRWRDELIFRWQLPMGFFGEGEQVNPSRWPEMQARRWGETAKGEFKAWYEVERIDGDIDTTVLLEGFEADAPQDWRFHHSIAYDTQTSAIESGGDGVVSVSFTASAGTNRVVAMGAGTNWSVANDTAIACTLGGASPSITRPVDEFDNTWQSTVCDVFIDSEIGSGAKTYQAVGTGGSGSREGSAMAVLSVSGVDQTTPAGGGAEAQANSGNASVTATGVGATDLVVDFVGSFAGTKSVGANQTERINVSAGGVRFGASTQAGADGGAMTWTITSGAEWTSVAFALKEASAGGQTVAILQASETETAQSLSHSKARTIGQVSEIETASPVTATRSRTLSKITETETASALTHSRAASLGRVAETETASVLTPKRTYTIGQVTELETAIAVTHTRSATIGRTTETETASPVSPVRTLPVGQVSEVETASAISHSRAYHIARATEFETSFSIGGAIAIGRVTELETALPIIPLRALAISTVQETETAGAAAPSRSVTIGRVVETEVASTTVPLRSYAILPIQETEAAHPITPRRSVRIQAVAEIETANASARYIAIGAVYELETARVFIFIPTAYKIGVATYIPAIVGVATHNPSIVGAATYDEEKEGVATNG